MLTVIREWHKWMAPALAMLSTFIVVLPTALALPPTRPTARDAEFFKQRGATDLMLAIVDNDVERVRPRAPGVHCA